MKELFTVHSQIILYLENNKILPSFQYGYRKNHNTTQAILDYTNYVSKAISKKLVTISIFMDLSKAFDTVDKDILEPKLLELGLSQESVQLITSYMSNRKLIMKNGTEYFNLKFGVPQGSILGPLLFIMYTSDMKDIAKNNKVIVYADDTTVLISGRNLTEAKQHCNDILDRFYNYFTVNKLSINASKTKYMIHKPDIRNKNMRKKLHDTTNTKIIMANTPLEEELSTKFLGMILNNKLTWEPHKKHIANKISKNMGIIYKCSEPMDEEKSINMYKAFIQPYFIYAIEVWGHSVKSSKDILMKLQSKALRVIFGVKRSDDAWRHNNGKIKSITELYEDSIRKISLKHQAGILPEHVSMNIMLESSINNLQNRISRTTLSRMYDYVPDEQNSSSFQQNCMNIWNNESLEFKSIPYSGNAATIYKALQMLSTRNK